MPQASIHLLLPVLRWCARLLGQRLEPIETPAPAPSAPSAAAAESPLPPPGRRTGPPEHWLEKVRHGCPHLLPPPGSPLPESAARISTRAEPHRPRAAGPRPPLIVAKNFQHRRRVEITPIIPETGVQPGGDPASPPVNHTARHGAPSPEPATPEPATPAPHGRAPRPPATPRAPHLISVDTARSAAPPPPTPTKPAPSLSPPARLVTAPPQPQRGFRLHSVATDSQPAASPASGVAPPAAAQPGRPSSTAATPEIGDTGEPSTPRIEATLPRAHGLEHPAPPVGPLPEAPLRVRHQAMEQPLPAAPAPAPDRWPALPPPPAAPQWTEVQEFWSDRQRQRHLAAEQGGLNG